MIVAMPDDFKKEEVVKSIKALGKQHGLKMKAIMKFIRMAVFGAQVSHKRNFFFN